MFLSVLIYSFLSLDKNTHHHMFIKHTQLLIASMLHYIFDMDTIPGILKIDVMIIKQ